MNLIDAAGTHTYLQHLNPGQRAAVEQGVSDGQPSGPLLIIAGAGTGKTTTLAHRVAHLVVTGADPQRILLLTFTRRAAAQMTRRAQRILSTAGAKVSEIAWSGTFHAMSNRLLRIHANSIGLDPSFTVLDRSDSADLMDLVRHDLGFASKPNRFPKKDTCLDIYSRTVNACCELAKTLKNAFPWCEEWAPELKQLFGQYVASKQRDNVLDYDDLLLYWRDMVWEPGLAAEVGARFDHVLVDEYQDTNPLQEAILLGMKPDGCGLTVVGDDAQSIYSFRAATVRNILDFPDRFSPPATVLKLEENYRSTQPILDASNAVMSLAIEGHEKRLFSRNYSHEKPFLVTAADELAQADHIITRALEHREEGLDLKAQAVLFRAAHHSALLEIELARRNIPFVKFGGLKFLEAAHIKDVISVLRLAENPRDTVAGFRVFKLLPGVGPSAAKKLLSHLGSEGFHELAHAKPPTAAKAHWPTFCALLDSLARPAAPWAGQVELVCKWYQPHLKTNYDDAAIRAFDLDKLEQISARYASRERFLSDLALDPPEATSGEAGDPLLDEDYLVLSTIHSAKGQEWDAVFVLNVTDGCIPSDLATDSPAEIEEERRLLYVAMTRAKRHLHLIMPMRFFRSQQPRYGDGHVFSCPSRFIADRILGSFERTTRRENVPSQEQALRPHARVDLAARMRSRWQ
jgi:DNA helicase-2/ATP-dependent DNA helicase PcrA